MAATKPNPVRRRHNADQHSAAKREQKAKTALPSQTKLLELGALAVSAGLTAATLRDLAEARRLRGLADALRKESAEFAAWAKLGANPKDAPTPDPRLDAWQAEFAGTGFAGG